MQDDYSQSAAVRRALFQILQVEVISAEELEKIHVLASMERNYGNKTKTAREMGKSVRTIRNKMLLYCKELPRAPKKD